MPSIVTVTEVRKEPLPSTRCLVRFSDGSELEFQNIDEIKAMAASMDSDPSFTQRLAVALWIAKNPSGSNTSLALRTVEFDLSAVSPIKVTG